jgi:deazaflavin-dependent oxidoreductase (nitroreductase family)
MNSDHYYNRPSRFRSRVYDPMVRAVIMHTPWSGFSRRDSVQVLAVRGRKTEHLYLHPVGVCSYKDDRYVISFYGESEWARNLRAGMEAELRDRKHAEKIMAIELADAEKLEFLAFLLDRYPMIIRVWWKINARRVTPAQMNMLAARYPVFRLTAA